MKILLALLITLSALPTLAQVEPVATPFTYIKFGSLLGRDFIEVRNPDYIDTSKVHYLVEVEGRTDKEILAAAKALYGKDYKCMLAEHFTEAMHAIGINVTDKVDMQLYLFSWGHKTFDLEDVPSTEDNVYEIQFSDERYCD
ncbi:hypothetical protein [Halobacteriovorax sp. JY17]|uniref:hypothetical protein n=1 Tax=Halobacteriovorax sp. JY17 TaxID=2014617 RepID=UPI000C5A2F20|nr:hypothetical protein [Halobacteriovorax sp. JY17]PIK16000.1 MAG: hypothetical protein CES88_04535 [Halobacteriovorax sp. JY17]